MQIHHAVGGAIPEKRMSQSISGSTPTDLLASDHSLRNRIPEPARVKIDDTLGAAGPEESMAPGYIGDRAKSAAPPNLLPAAHAVGGRGVVSADRMEIDDAVGRPAP